MSTTLTIPIKFLADSVIEAAYGLDQTAISLVLCGTALHVYTGAGVQPHCSKLVGGWLTPLPLSAFIVALHTSCGSPAHCSDSCHIFFYIFHKISGSSTSSCDAEHVQHRCSLRWCSCNTCNLRWSSWYSRTCIR